jgi:hypothetical protein
MHAYPCHDPWATRIKLDHAKAESEFPMVNIGTCQLRGKSLTEKHRSIGFTGVWHWVDNPTQKNVLL